MISEQYRDMCVKAEELKQYRPKRREFIRGDDSVYIKEYWYDGDFVYIPEDGEDYSKGIGTIFDDRVCHSGYHNYDSNWYIPEGTVWLPRPDQLMTILIEIKDKNHWGIYEYFINWYNKQEISISENTMAEMWLMFFMESVHNKKWYVWEGEGKWI